MYVYVLWIFRTCKTYTTPTPTDKKRRIDHVNIWTFGRYSVLLLLTFKKHVVSSWSKQYPGSTYYKISFADKSYVTIIYFFLSTLVSRILISNVLSIKFLLSSTKFSARWPENVDGLNCSSVGRLVLFIHHHHHIRYIHGTYFGPTISCSESPTG